MSQIVRVVGRVTNRVSHRQRLWLLLLLFLFTQVRCRRLLLERLLIKYLHVFGVADLHAVGLLSNDGLARHLGLLRARMLLLNLKYNVHLFQLLFRVGSVVR